MLLFQVVEFLTDHDAEFNPADLISGAKGLVVSICGAYAFSALEDRHLEDKWCDRQPGGGAERR